MNVVILCAHLLSPCRFDEQGMTVTAPVNVRSVATTMTARVFQNSGRWASFGKSHQKRSRTFGPSLRGGATRGGLSSSNGPFRGSSTATLSRSVPSMPAAVSPRMVLPIFWRERAVCARIKVDPGTLAHDRLLRLSTTQWGISICRDSIGSSSPSFFHRCSSPHGSCTGPAKALRRIAADIGRCAFAPNQTTS